MNEQIGLGSERQAGASGAVRRDAGGLRFETKEDALNFAREIAEEGRRRAIQGWHSVAEAYAKGDVEIVVEVTTLADSDKFNLVFRRDPSRRIECDPPAHQGRIVIRDADFVSRTNTEDTSVFIRTSQGERGVESWVPCFAYVQRRNECDQIGMDIPAPPFDFKFEVIGGFANWEVDSIRALPAALKRGVAERLVERVLKVVDDVVSGQTDGGWYWLSEAQTDDFFASLVVNFFDKFVTARIDHGQSHLFKVGDPCICLVKK